MPIQWVGGEEGGFKFRLGEWGGRSRWHRDDVTHAPIGTASPAGTMTLGAAAWHSAFPAGTYLGFQLRRGGGGRHID